MRVARSLVLLLLAACAHPSQPNPSPAPRSGDITGRVVFTSRPDTLPLPPPLDPRTAAFIRRSDSLAAMVDTIVVLRPDSILLRVGQATPVLDSVVTEGRRSSGEKVPTYPAWYAIEDNSIAQSRPGGLTGLQPGRTRLVITVMSRTAHAPPSYVPIRVVP